MENDAVPAGGSALLGALDGVTAIGLSFPQGSPYPRTSFAIHLLWPCTWPSPFYCCQISCGVDYDKKHQEEDGRRSVADAFHRMTML